MFHLMTLLSLSLAALLLCVKEIYAYLPRNGIATPAQIITAVQQGFNMGNDLAIFLTYAAFLVEGNPITNRMSIGCKTHSTGPNPPAPGIVGGLDTHAVFEGVFSLLS
ncbi:hypothetical protein JB92DRAFT_2836373 [Gautieria morchelliformis]|nr:hypothetical protein JB92DRAFT_2836373 [Gautieria morchelliformis]